MAVRVRGRDGSVEIFPDGTSPAAIRMAMLAYDNQDDWGGLAGRVGEAVGQAAEPQLSLPEPSDVEEIEVTAPRVARSVGHPGLAESFIPVWGSAREAIADFQEGDYLGAALNGGLAASDLFLAGSVGKAVAKGGLYAVKGAIGDGAAQAAWRKSRKAMLDRGLIEKGQHGHHWGIPQGGFGKYVPNWIKNHPANINPMPTVYEAGRNGKRGAYVSEVHSRIHGPFRGADPYGFVERTWRGMPTWAKVVDGQIVGRAVGTTKARNER